MENANNEMFYKKEGKYHFLHDKFYLSDEEYATIMKLDPNITNQKLFTIASNIIHQPNLFVNDQFVDPNNTFFNCVKQEITTRKKQERMYSEEPVTTQNDMSNNEAPKESVTQNQEMNEESTQEATKEIVDNEKIDENSLVNKESRKKVDNDFNEKKDFLKEVLLKLAQLCEEFTVPNEDGVFDCSNECPFYSENIGCLLKDNNPLSQEKIATILIIYYSRTKDSGESVVYDYVNNKIKDLTEQEREMLRESIK